MPDDRVVVYSAAEKQYCTALLEGFSVRHPGISVDFEFGISVALHERYLAENPPRADVLWSSAVDLQMSLAVAGHALPHPSAEAAALPPGAAWRDLAYATTIEPLRTLVHRDLFDARIPAGSIAEIAAALGRDPDRYRGRIAICDIERNGLAFIALLHESRREADFEAFLQALAACRPQRFGSAPPLVEAVTSGRAALAFPVLGSYAERAARASASVAIARSEVPPVAVSRVILICRRAPHPGAARCFVDYVLSRDGQRRLRDAGLYPIRRDAGGSDAAVSPVGLDEASGRLLDTSRRRALTERWQAAFGQPASLPSA